MEYGIKILKDNKIPRTDEIYSEVLKLLNDHNLNILTTVLNNIYDSGNISNEWLESNCITLPQNTNPHKCSNVSLIHLMSHALKIQVEC